MIFFCKNFGTLKRSTKLYHGQSSILNQTQQLKVGDVIDHRDNVGRFALAKIIGKRSEKLKIHYGGWNAKYDIWC